MLLKQGISELTSGITLIDQLYFWIVASISFRNLSYVSGANL